MEHRHDSPRGKYGADMQSMNDKGVGGITRHSLESRAAKEAMITITTSTVSMSMLLGKVQTSAHPNSLGSQVSSFPNPKVQSGRVVRIKR